MTELNAVETAVTDLELGMYVTALDRPWAETPFLLQGFYVESEEDIEQLERHCKFVYVDVYRSKLGKGHRSSRIMGTAGHQTSAKRMPVNVPAESVQFRPSSGNVAAQLFSHRKLKTYQDTASLQEELPLARMACDELDAAMNDLMEQVGRGAKMDLGGIKQAVEPMVDSIVRNPDACVWLARFKTEDSYTFRHAVGAATWTAALGRHMGLPSVDLRRMATGALLFDVGKLKVPSELLRRRARLTTEEFELVKSHVQYGLELLKDTGALNRTVTDMVEHHHERFGGHGYPQGLEGDAIPVFGRIAALVDCYDAITSQRPYSPAMSPSHAVKKLYAWRNIDFQAEIVEEFIQAIGLYPAGSLVELSNGEVGVVMAGYRTRRLRPELLMLLDRDKQPLAELQEIDLKIVTHDEDGKPLEITTSLEPGAFGVDLQRLAM